MEQEPINPYKPTDVKSKYPRPNPWRLLFVAITLLPLISLLFVLGNTIHMSRVQGTHRTVSSLVSLAVMILTVLGWMPLVFWVDKKARRWKRRRR